MRLVGHQFVSLNTLKEIEVDKTKTIEIVDALLADAGLITYSTLTAVQQSGRQLTDLLEVVIIPDHLGGGKLQAVEIKSFTCSDCVCNTDERYKNACSFVECTSSCRNDGRNVIFIQAAA